MFSSLARSSILIICVTVAVCAQDPAAWLDVPFVEQVEKGCGSASIAMVIRYWDKQLGRESGASADANEIHRLLYEPGTEGVYASAMEKYFEQQKFLAIPFRGDWDLLQQHLKKGRPLIAALKPSSGSLHYVVVVGVDPKNNLLLLNDPARRKLLKEDRSEFEKQWSATGNWTLLAVPQPEGDG